MAATRTNRMIVGAMHVGKWKSKGERATLLLLTRGSALLDEEI